MYLNETKWSFEENFQSVSRNFLKEFKVFKRSISCVLRRFQLFYHMAKWHGKGVST